MRVLMVVALLLTQAGSAIPENPDAAPLTASIEETLRALTNLVIHEKVDRYSRTGRLRRKDTLDSTVEVLDGVEQYAAVSRHGQILVRVEDIKGLWSFGEMATLLRTTRDGLLDRPTGDVSAGILNFHFPAHSGRWFVIADARKCWLDFDGQVFFSPEDGRRTRISWISKPLPADTGIDRVIWTVDFKPTDVSGETLTLPATAIYQVTRTGAAKRADWNVTTFAHYERYEAQVAMRYNVP